LSLSFSARENDTSEEFFKIDLIVQIDYSVVTPAEQVTVRYNKRAFLRYSNDNLGNSTSLDVLINIKML
jgi:hypothetical protein